MKLILFIIAILLTVGVSSAELDAADAGAGMIESGINRFIIGIADDLYDCGVGIFDTVEGDDAASKAIFSIATYTYDPFESEAVKGMQELSAILFLVMMTLYIFIGAIGVVVSRFIPNLTPALTFVMGKSAHGNYISNLATGMIVAIFTYTGIKFVLTFNYIITHLIIVDVLETVAPSVDNVIMYLMMAVCYFFMNVFFAWRMLVIGVVTSFALIFGVMLVYDSTKNIARGIFSYFISMVFLQSIICGVTSVGIKIIQGLGLAPDQQIIMYLILTFLLIVIALMVCLGIHRAIWGTKKAGMVLIA